MNMSLSLRVAAAALAVFAIADVQARSFLRAGEYLGNDQTLVSENRAFFAYMQGDGNFVVYKGTSFQDMYGALWSTGAKRGGQYFAIQQGDGNFVVYAGTGPADNRGFVWHHGRTTAGGQAFTILQDTGNLCTYKGTGPSDNKGHLWCSDKYTTVTWVPDGKYVDLASINDNRLTYDSNNGKVKLIKSTQRWGFLPDGTLRMGADRTKCLHALSNGRVVMGQCDGSATSTGWSYRPADKSIRSQRHPKGCLMLNHDGDGVAVPDFSANSVCVLDIPTSEYKYQARWNLS